MKEAPLDPPLKSMSLRLDTRGMFVSLQPGVLLGEVVDLRSDIPPFIPLIAAILCSTAAAIRGSQWWLTITIVAALWGALVLFQLIVPH